MNKIGFVMPSDKDKHYIQAMALLEILTNSKEWVMGHSFHSI